MPNFNELFTKIASTIATLRAKKYIAGPLRVFNILQWILIPMLIFMMAENTLKKVDEEKPQWYPGAELTLKHHKVDYVFLGSSRVAAAVNRRVFMKCMEAELGRKVVAINLGQGYSTIQQHYLGLRNLLEKYPDSFKNFTVFFEAPGGVVNYYYYSKWSYDWVNSGQSQLLTPLLRPADLFHFFMRSSEDLDTKTYVVLKYYLNGLKIIRLRERVKDKIDTKLMEWLEKILVRRLNMLPSVPGKKLDLTESGGVRINAQNLFESQAIGVRMVEEELRRLHLCFYWDSTVFGELVQLIKAHGGKVMFFKMPISSLRNRVYVTKLHAGNQAIFKDFLKKWDAQVLYPDFKTTDEDFPDFSHLRFSRSTEYSEKLATAYIEYLKTK